MKEYIKLFNNLQSADGYVINDIPFICTAISGDGIGNINLRCNEGDKKLEVAGDTIEIVDNGIPNDEIWYTSSDGNIVTPHSASSLPTIVSNTYINGKGVIKFATDVTSIGNDAFYNCTKLTSVIIPNSVTSIIWRAFYACTDLTSVVIPDSVTRINYDAFQCIDMVDYYIGSLQTITVGETVFRYDGTSKHFTITLGNGTNVDLIMWTEA